MSPLMIETTTKIAVGNVRIPRSGKTNVKPVIKPNDEKKSGSGTVRSHTRVYSISQAYEAVEHTRSFPDHFANSLHQPRFQRLLLI